MTHTYTKIVMGAVTVLALVGVFFAFSSSLFTTDLEAQTLERSKKVQLQQYDGYSSYRSSALISLTPQAAPEIAVRFIPDGGWDSSTAGKLEIEVYEMLPEELTEFLVYEVIDDNGSDRYKNINFQPNKDRLLTTIEKENHGSKTPILLPVDGTGAWLVRAIVNDSIYNDVVVQRSQIASVTKNSGSDLLFWTQDITTGKRVSSGFVEMYNLNDEVNLLDRSAIMADGVATLGIDDTADIAVVRSVSGEYAVVPLNIPETEYYRTSQFRTPNPVTKFYLFTDRPVYQPGDTVKYKAIVREDADANYEIPDTTVQVRIYKDWNNRDTPIYSKIHTLSEAGSTDGSFVMPADLETGYYQIEVSDPAADREWWLRTVESFQVESYRKPEYFLESSVAEQSVVRGEDIVFTVSGAYFFGQPLSNETIEIGIGEREFYYGYWMDEADLARRIEYGNWWRSSSYDRTEQLDSAGNTEVLIKTDSFDFKSDGSTRPTLVTLDARFNDASGNNVKTAANVLVWPASFSIVRDGWWRSGTVGQELELPLVARSHNGASVADISLTVEQERNWWNRRQRSDWHEGSKRSQYTYDEKTETLNDLTLKTDAAGKTAITFTPTESGSYRFLVTARDEAGREVTARFSAWIRDPSLFTYRNTNNQTNLISIDADRPDGRYLESESPALTIAAETRDRDVWLTTERGSVLRYEVLELNDFVTTVPFTFTEGDLPNVFVGVSSFGPEGFMSDTTELKIDTSRQETNLELAFDQETYSPGETVTATIKATSELTGAPVDTEVTLWSVDKALYEVAADRRDNITDFFWRDRYNATRRAHSLQGIYSTGGAEKGCFAAGTEVKVPGGHTAIEDIEIGDYVITRNTTGDLVEAKVTNTFSHEVDGYLVINGELKLTPEHVLWVNGAWSVAGNVQVGDELLGTNGEAVEVSSLEWQRGSFMVHNLTVADEHTYIAEGVWVHNDKGGFGPRTDFSDVAYWNPRVLTGADGVATVRFTLPDNLTTWVMNAVAANQQTEVGESLEEFIVTKPVIVRPILPNYLRTGDTVSLASLVYNYTNATQDFNLSCRLGDDSWNTARAIAQDNFTTYQGPEVTVAEAGERLFNCSAIGQQTAEGDAVMIPFNVRDYGFNESKSFVAVGDTSAALTTYADSDPALSAATVVVSPSVFGTLPEAMNYLLQYPYGCVEQTTSRFVPAVIAAENQTLFADYIKDKEVEEMVAAGLKRLHSLRGKQTGWSWWSGGEVNPLLTAYVAEYVLRAEAAGYELPSGLKVSIRNYASRIQQKLKREESVTLEEKVAASYIQAFLREKTPEKIILGSSVDPDVLAMGIIANAAHGHSVGPEADILLSKAEVLGDGLVWPAGSSRLFGSKDASTALASEGARSC